MASIQPELWVDSPRDALTFYQAAFGATVLHRVGEGDDIVAQLGVGEAAFWVAPSASTMKRLSPRSIDGATSRTLLVVNDPETILRQAVAAGATETSPVDAGSAPRGESPGGVALSAFVADPVAARGPVADRGLATWQAREVSDWLGG